MREEKNLIYIKIEDIIPNRFQPRLTFDEEALKELAISIKQHGIIQPLVVRRLINGKYEIIAGERRYKASQIAGLKIIPVIVTELDDNASAEVALIENIQRRDLSAIEEAKSYKKILERGYLTQDELAKKLGISQSQVANKIRLLNLTEEAQDALMDNRISERHARSLLQLDNPNEQVKMLNRVINERLTVRELDIAIKKVLDGEATSDISLALDNDIETLDVTFPSEDINVYSDEELVKMINDSKLDLEKEYDTLNIPTAEEAKIYTKQDDKKSTIERGNLNSVINAIKELERAVKEAGFDIELENYDFEDLYQVIIKIEK